MPAITNDRITAGPASGTAADRTKKMPVPIVAPTPNMASWKVPIERGRCSPCSPAACCPRATGPASAAVAPASTRNSPLVPP